MLITQVLVPKTPEVELSTYFKKILVYPLNINLLIQPTLSKGKPTNTLILSCISADSVILSSTYQTTLSKHQDDNNQHHIATDSYTYNGSSG